MYFAFIDPEDVAVYRVVLAALGGKASIPQIERERSGRVDGVDEEYVAACLLPAAGDDLTDPDCGVAFPSCRGRDAEGRTLWVTREHWTADDLGGALVMLRARAEEFERMEEALAHVARRVADLLGVDVPDDVADEYVEQDERVLDRLDRVHQLPGWLE